MPDPEYYDITSPGSAFAWQARVEERLMIVMTNALTDFLSAVYTAALSQGLSLLPGTVEDLWTQQVTSALQNEDWLTETAYDYLIDPILNSDMPAEVYSSVHEVLTTAQREEWSRSTLRDRLDAVLDPDTSEVIQAAGDEKPRRKRLWDKARTVGTSWRNNVQRLVQTKVTGLQGFVGMKVLEDNPDINYKRWVSKRDSRVRPTHVEADGQTVPAMTAFEVGGASLMYPGQAGAQYEEIVRCRCVMVGIRR